MLDNSKFTYIDDLLGFAGVHVLSFSEKGDLLDIRTASRNFYGWSAENLQHFNLEDHFLEVNHLPLSNGLTEIASAGEEPRNTYVFGLPDGGITDEMRIMWRVQPSNGVPGNITALVSVSKTGTERYEDIDKKYYYQAIHLPGFFHNLNGPLGTIIGRIELLQHQYPEIKALNDLIRVSNKLQEMVQTVSFKIHNERSSSNTQPMNLSRFLRNELNFLKSDSFFKHQVETFYDLSEQVPQFNSNYAAMSGVISEFYQLFRNMTQQYERYTLLVKSFRDSDIIGFSMEMNGTFRSSYHALPLAASVTFCDDDATAGELLNPYLRYCMERHQGRFSLDCQENCLSLCYSFPIIH